MATDRCAASMSMVFRSATDSAKRCISAIRRVTWCARWSPRGRGRARICDILYPSTLLLQGVHLCGPVLDAPCDVWQRYFFSRNYVSHQVIRCFTERVVCCAHL